jgi:hypothetical protein
MASVDPRFDPQFQRGYDPEVHGTPRVEERSRVEERREAPRLDTPGVEERHEAPGLETPREQPAPLDPPEEPTRRIPYRLVLLLASVGSVLAAAVLLWQRITADPLDAYYGSNPGILFRQQLIDSLLIPLLIAGLTGVILWLALGALQRRDDA